MAAGEKPLDRVDGSLRGEDGGPDRFGRCDDRQRPTILVGQPIQRVGDQVEQARRPSRRGGQFGHVAAALEHLLVDRREHQLADHQWVAVGEREHVLMCRRREGGLGDLVGDGSGRGEVERAALDALQRSGTDDPGERLRQAAIVATGEDEPDDALLGGVDEAGRQSRRCGLGLVDDDERPRRLGVGAGAQRQRCER